MAFSFSRVLMRDFSPIVLVLASSMGHQWKHFSVGCRITSQFVGDECERWLSLVFQDLPKEAFGGFSVPLACDQNIEYVTILIHNSPKIMPSAADCDKQLVHVPDSPSRPCRRRSVRAYAGPNFWHQDRIASYDTDTPRSASRSSTSRKLRVKRWYSQTAWLIISGGNRWRQYRDFIGPIVSPTGVNLTMPAEGKRLTVRADAAFAKPEIYEALERRGVDYVIRQRGCILWPCQGQNGNPG